MRLSPFFTTSSFQENFLLLRIFSTVLVCCIYSTLCLCYCVIFINGTLSVCLSHLHDVIQESPIHQKPGLLLELSFLQCT
ncbi:hypothetical protein [Klebsiella phage 05F01]|nr:hypothetical protein [Klebsiella phage 05F01]